MRSIFCRPCSDPAPFRELPASEDGPAEHVRRVDGQAAIDGMVCDGCNKPLELGEDVTAWSVWAGSRVIPEWESEFLKLPERPKQEGGA